MLNCVCYEHWCRHPPQTFPETASETTWQHLTLSSLQVKILSVHLFCSKWASLRQFFERKNAGKSWRSLWTVTIYIFLAPSVSTDTMGVNWQLFYFPLQEDGTWWLIHKIYNAGRDSIQSLFSIGLGRQWWRYYYGLPSGCQPLYARRHAEELIIKQSFFCSCWPKWLKQKLKRFKC